jgi:Icc-related predicted phosphoesterase
MAPCFFASDLHGREDRYAKLFAAIASERPTAVFLGGDLLPHVHTAIARLPNAEHAGSRSVRASKAPDAAHGSGFLADVVSPGLEDVRQRLGEACPRVFVIPGNDDPRVEEAAMVEIASRGLWDYVHDRRVEWQGSRVYGYACVPPTPFLLKDWERYDVSRFVDPGCVAPEDGWHSAHVDLRALRHATIAGDLASLAGADDQTHAIWLLHSPPYATVLDRAALDGKRVDGVPLDVHVGSVAIRRFIEARQPAITLHGHIHESTRLTSRWRERIGRTHCFSAAHDGPELALVVFDPGDPETAERWLI